MASTAEQDRLRKPLTFEAIDPRGNLVICARSTWDSHIAKEHPEMAERLAQVIAAVENPDRMRESTARSEAQVFERAVSDQVQIRVVVTFDDPSRTQSGGSVDKVNTAFPVQSDQYDQPQLGDSVYERPSPLG